MIQASFWNFSLISFFIYPKSVIGSWHEGEICSFLQFSLVFIIAMYNL